MRASPSSSRPTKTTPSRRAAGASTLPGKLPRKRAGASNGVDAGAKQPKGKASPGATSALARLRVRDAEPADGALIAELRWTSDVQHAQCLPDYFRAPPRGARGVPRSSTSQRVLVVEEAEQEAWSVRGYLVLHLTATPPDPASVPGPRARVDAVVVDRTARRRGAGKALMEKAAEVARAFGAAELVLTVWQGNDAAGAFYEALGFEPLARVLRQRL